VRVGNILLSSRLVYYRRSTGVLGESRSISISGLHSHILDDAIVQYQYELLNLVCVVLAFSAL
jgi:hypothetical protein